jgi:hypothetical protein
VQHAAPSAWHGGSLLLAQEGIPVEKKRFNVVSARPGSVVAAGGRPTPSPVAAWLQATFLTPSWVGALRLLLCWRQLRGEWYSGNYSFIRELITYVF